MARRGGLVQQTVLITGAASGIGAATAQRLVARGARVALLDRDAAGVGAMAEQLGPSVIGCVADVRHQDSLDAAVAMTLGRFGRLDVVVANAGVYNPTRTTLTEDPGAVERLVDINLLGVWRTVRAGLPAVIESRGHLVLTASVLAAMAAPTAAAYAASKAGVEGLGRSLRLELASRGVSVGIAYLGGVETPMLQRVREESRSAPTLLDAAGGWFGPVSADRVASALVRGVERRSARVVAPGWVHAALAARTATDPLLGRMPRVRAVISAADAADQKEDHR